LPEARIARKAANRLSIREGGLEVRGAVLELWQQADAMPDVTVTADGLRRVIRDGPDV
jgi:hypothetical protein